MAARVPKIPIIPGHGNRAGTGVEATNRPEKIRRVEKYKDRFGVTFGAE